jgi:hypothetical protein
MNPITTETKQEYGSDEIWRIAEFVQPIANIHQNSVGGQRHEIRNAERLHWLEGLRCAELYIKQHQEGLLVTDTQQRKMQRTIAQLEDDIEELREQLGQSTESRAKRKIERDIEAKQDRIRLVKFNLSQLQPLIRDSMLLLAEAFKERTRIIEANPQSEELSYVEIQQGITAEITERRMTKYIAGRITGLPETAGVALTDISPEKRGEVLLNAASVARQLEASIATAGLAQESYQQQTPRPDQAHRLPNRTRQQPSVVAEVAPARLPYLGYQSASRSQQRSGVAGAGVQRYMPSSLEDQDGAEHY